MDVFSTDHSPLRQLSRESPMPNPQSRCIPGSPKVKERQSEIVADQTNGFVAAVSTIREGGVTAIKQKLWNSQGCHHNPLFDQDLEALSYTQRDIMSIAFHDEESFQMLKANLRSKGCVTNCYLKENIHFYVKHIKDARAKRNQIEPRTAYTAAA